MKVGRRKGDFKSITLQFIEEENIDIEQISTVQRPIFEDMRNDIKNLLRI